MSPVTEIGTVNLVLWKRHAVLAELEERATIGDPWESTGVATTAFFRGPATSINNIGGVTGDLRRQRFARLSRVAAKLIKRDDTGDTTIATFGDAFTAYQQDGDFWMMAGAYAERTLATYYPP